MNLKRPILQATLFLAALAASLILPCAARAQAVSTRFVGKFTVTSPVHWGKATLPPGTYSLRIDSTTLPIMAIIRSDSSTFAIRVITVATSDYHNGSNALRLNVRNGSLVVHSLALADLDTVLIYDPSPAQEEVEEAHAGPTVSVLVARK
ncbi:MAG TPA: hypothetical protein VGP66_07225 [Candidatus Acidoferrum sp.]|jgi:hypothetical protein|nr:hypothetical protein [Candidatus Acidoferrum sp.]